MNKPNSNKVFNKKFLNNNNRQSKTTNNNNKLFKKLKLNKKFPLTKKN